MERIRTDIAVVGAGVVGLAAALAVGRMGLRAVLLQREPVVEPTPLPSQGFDARVYAISPASRQLLESIGAWSMLEEARIAPVYDMRVFPHAGGPDERGKELHFSAFDAGCEALAWIIEQDNLVQALARSLAATRVRRMQAEVVAWEPGVAPGHAGLATVGGLEVHARLVLAADGANSPLRRLAGIEYPIKPYGQQALVAHLACERPHRDAALQWFGDHGVMALLPMPASSSAAHPHCVSLVLSTPDGRAESLMADGPQALTDAVMRISGGALGAMAAASSPRSFPLRLGQAASLTAQRLALIGDAAHQVHPLAGQGLNLGLGDVADLAAVLADARRRYRAASFDPGHELLLRAWRRRRVEPVSALRFVTDNLKWLFDATPSGLPSGALSATRAARDAGWRIVCDSPRLRRGLARAAAGLHPL